MKKRTLIASAISLLILAVFAAVTFASYHPNEHQAIVSPPVKKQVVVEKRVVRVIKHRKAKKVTALPVASKTASPTASYSASVQSAESAPAKSDPDPAQTHSSGGGNYDDEGEDEGEDEGDNYESDDEGGEEDDD